MHRLSNVTLGSVCLTRSEARLEHPHNAIVVVLVSGFRSFIRDESFLRETVSSVLYLSWFCVNYYWFVIRPVNYSCTPRPLENTRRLRDVVVFSLLNLGGFFVVTRL